MRVIINKQVLRYEHGKFPPDRQTDHETDQQTDRPGHRKVSLIIRETSFYETSKHNERVKNEWKK